MMGNSPQHICTLFASASHEPVEQKGSAFSWLIPGKRRAEKEDGFIRALCDKVYHLPSVYAAAQTTPDLSHVPIKAMSNETGIMGLYSGGNGVEISAWKTGGEWFDEQMATLPHELRHGYQVRSNFLPSGFNSNDVRDHIFYNRVMEADATAFSVTALYEHWLDSGDSKPLDALRQHHPEVVDAYYESLWDNEDAHWDGSAANAAFKAYFANDDKGNLKSYDLAMCKIFSRAAGDVKNDTPSSGVDRKILMDSLATFASMPYMNDLGNVKQRPNYRPQDVGYDVIMGHISPEVETYIQRAKSAPALKPH